VFFEQYHSALFNCTKPYQYVGGEFLSANKDFDKAVVRFALAFPDKYEIGISNLGLRVLYDRINARAEFMADRVYAPEKDFKPEPLYALESKRPIKDFDAVGFSLQYELAYPTVLKMLDMAGIAHRNDQRGEDAPIILAGGPCAFNPLPMADFVDVFMIGDGEDSIVEVCEILERTKGLPRAERIKALSTNGRWSKLVGGGVTKRIAELTYETAPKSYPIPFSSGVHDRAVVEIRRGCGRMCRFCQPGHVTLPVRERPAEDIVKIAKELVQNTGYDEYSLLSLSSNDYSNIKALIKELGAEFNDKKVSVSLPSQRIDGFDPELAQLVQSVRKSAMTLAPEAGSQRLRDFIKKNISGEQILHAVGSLYDGGWTRVKLYFICGLPSETLTDMDEMAELLAKIKQRAPRIQLTCSLSIFVPKPFTPFQWHGQMDLDEVTAHIHYLKDKAKHLKGVKINYHDKFVSRIEAVLTRGDDSLNAYIEALYKKGCYLDAWGEHFDHRVWEETAQECGLDIAALAQKQYPTDAPLSWIIDGSEKCDFPRQGCCRTRRNPLPWDFIDVGVDKEWFIKEYNDANTAAVCQTGCVGCGVCKNLKTKKVMAPICHSERSEESHMDSSVALLPQNDVFRYRIKLTKTGILRYFSHLDWQNTFFKSVARSGLNVAFSQGFNPSMKISLGVALPLFAQSECEFVDIELTEKITPTKLKQKLEKVLPEQSKIVSVREIPKAAPAIDHTVAWAEYRVALPRMVVRDAVGKAQSHLPLYNFDDLLYNTDKVLNSDEIFIEKKNKKGLIQKINIKPSIKSYEAKDKCLFIVLKTGQGGRCIGISDERHEQGNDVPALRADVLMNVIAPDVIFDITRTRFFDQEMREL
jgi:radical SAM-linked protein